MTNVLQLSRAAALMALLVALAGCDLLLSAEQRYQRAEDFVERGEHRRAVIEIKNALDKDPDMAAARLLLADVTLFLGDPTSADRELRKIATPHEAARYNELRSRIDLALGRFQEVLDRASSDDAQLAPAEQAYFRGLALLGLKQPAEAEKELSAAIDADPSFVEAKAARLEVLAALRNMPAALESSEALVREHSDSALGWYVRGVLLARTDAHEEAATALECARELAPKQLEFMRRVAVLVTLTDVRLSQGDAAKARAVSDELSQVAVGSPIALIASSRVSMAEERYVAAVADLRRVVNGNPQLVQARFMLAAALLTQGNLQQAGQELAAVVEQQPENLEARQLLAQVRMRQDDPDGAMRVIVPALQSGADDTRLTALLDVARARSGNSAEAIDMLERALQMAPDNQALKIQLAGSYLQAGAADKALALLRGAEGGEASGGREALLLQAVMSAKGEAAARAEIESMLAAHPSDNGLVTLASAFYARIGDSAAARRLLTDALRRSPANTDLLFASAQLELSSNRVNDARAALDRVLQLDAKHAPARLALARLNIATGNLDGARDGLEVLRQADSGSIVPRLLLAQIALLKSDIALANALVSEVLQAAPNRGDVYDAVGTLFLNNARFDQAIVHLQQGARLDPTEARIWLKLGRAQQALGKTDAARESLARALELRPGWPAAEGALAFIDLQTGQGAVALERVTQLERKRPNDPAVLTLTGEVHAALRNYAEAGRAFEAAARIQPSGPLAIKTYEALRAAGQPNAAEPLARWVQQNPGELVYRAVLADAYVSGGDRTRAIQQYEHIVGAEPGHVMSLNNLAWLYFEAKDGRAEQLARKAYTLSPSNPAVADTLGWILVQSDRAQEALPLLRAAASAGKNAEIRYHYAVALARSGAHWEARAELDVLLETEPAFPSRDAAQQLRDSLAAGVSAKR